MTTLAQYQLKRLEAIKAARSKLLPFILYNFPGEFDVNWHHRYCCSVFDDFAAGKIPRLMVFMPPQHGKSTMMTEFLPPFLFGHNPNEKVILCGYNAELASKFNRKIQRIIDSDKYREIFPETTLNSKNVVTNSRGSYVRNSSEFEIVGHQGSLRVSGVGGGIASYPAYTALLDDVIKNAEEAYSATYRQKLYDWYTDELEARLHNNSRVAFTITRRHEDDLAGRLLDRDGTVEEGGKWTVVKLPALKEDDHNPNDPREIGGALWPNRHSQERMEDVKEKSPRTFTSLYQQRPAPIDGNLITREFFGRYNPNEVYFNDPRFFGDTAYTKNTTSDYTAILAYEKIDNFLYLKDLFHEKLTTRELCEKLPLWIGKHYGWNSMINIEPKANGKDLVDTIRHNTELNIREAEAPTKDKIARTNAAMMKIQSGRVLLPKGAPWVEPFIAECMAFPNGAHDDRVDSLIGAIEDVFQSGMGGGMAGHDHV